MKTASLSTRLLLMAGGAITVILIAATAFSAFTTKQSVEARIYKEADAEATAIADAIGAKASLSAAVGKTMIDTLAALHETGGRDRQAYIAILKSVAVENKDIFGTWMAEAPNALDGSTEAGLAGANEEGVFTPYWTKNAAGNVDFSTFGAKYDAPWYALAAESGKASLTEPYAPEAIKALIASAAFPVMSGGQLIGVGGVDFSLAELTGMLSQMSPFGTGRSYLLSAGGNWLVGPSEANLTKPYEGQGADIVRQALSSGQTAIIQDIEDGAYDRIVYPFAIPALNTRWVVLVDVPSSAFTAPVWSAVTELVIAGLVILLAVVGTMALAIRRVVTRPISQLVGSVETLSRGEYETKVEGGERGDEVGALSQALEEFRHRLRQGLAAEQTATIERRNAEETRTQSEAERRATDEAQARVVAALGEGLIHLASGNLVHGLGDGFEGPYRKLKDDYESAIANLRATMIAVSQSVGSIENGTEEISSASEHMTQRIEGQAASVEEAVAALREITSQVSENAEFAAAAAQTVRSARDDAQSADRVVQQAIDAMRGIATSSEKIEAIVGVINEISFQTNLLALNAGVEAARAGEAGKGFAVVAQEVRALSQRSASAAEEIRQLITASSEDVQKGVGFVDGAGEALRRIAAQVLDIDNQVERIASVSRSQATGLSEISTAVGQMDQITQQNAAMIEEANAATQELRGQAKTLERLVASFEIGSTQPRGSMRHVA
ncbi:MAG: HAMP domain-containing protein [Fulvimarina manganoxydans]|uniref:methyl-accepting chemotaxis protein n=1 Tax=Fulvimarina manganoxydans TaxID=937218 RepID=UPI002357D38A|nr:methyl-accepting chemotaxis protein [Fulvimarina manganoxydans]MCK5934113.1 HAMP domain-containing protein [Fulvimarina manganoxydans]